MRYLFLFFSALLFSSLASAQTVDSVVVSGRIRNLSARLYRESPTVLVSRNNILQASRELVRPAPLNVDGTFRVALPLIYPLEEMYFNYGRISTAFLASVGTLTIDLDADSLFTTAVPFRFGGVNAQVNGQYARYKAFEATYPNKPDNDKLSKSVGDLVGDDAVFQYVLSAYQAPYQAFALRESPFPLLGRWIQSVNRYNAAGFVYAKAAYEGNQVPVSLNDQLRPPDDRLLTAARTAAMNRFAEFAVQRASTPDINGRSSLSIKDLSTLLLRYGRNLTEAERTRLQGYVDGSTARASDLRFFDGLVKRSNDTIQRLVTYQQLIQRSRQQFDKAGVDFITAYGLATSLPSLTLDVARLLYDYARPQILDPALGQSLDELYQLEVKDSVRVRAAVRVYEKAGSQANSLEVSTGVFVTSDAQSDNLTLFDRLVTANRGKLTYVLLVNPRDEADRQAALDAQRLRDAYRSRDVSLLYVAITGPDPNTWVEFSTKNNLVGDHLLVIGTVLLSEVFQRLHADDSPSATVINRVGKVVKRNAPLPGAFEEVRKVIEKNL